MFRRWLAVVGAFVVVLLGATPASAHTELTSSNPTNGAIINSVPPVITLTFNEPLQGTSALVGVIIGTGNPVQVEAPVAGDTVTIDTTTGPVADLVAGGATGTWAIAYQVVSGDGHPVNSALTFTVDPNAAPAVPTAEPTAEATTSAAPEAPTSSTPGDSVQTSTTEPPGTDGAPTSSATAVAGATNTDSTEETGSMGPLAWGLIGAGAVVILALVLLADRRAKARRDPGEDFETKAF